MKRTTRKKRWYPNRYLSYRSPTTIGILVSVILLTCSIVFKTMHHLVGALSWSFAELMSALALLLLILAGIMILCTVKEKLNRAIYDDILLAVGQRFLRVEYGNPLNLKAGDIAPAISIRSDLRQGYIIRISCTSVPLETISNMSSVVSDALSGKLSDYAVIKKKEDIAGCFVDFYIENINKKYSDQRIINTPSDIKPPNPYTLTVKDDFEIDLTKIQNASTIIAGRTRSGKTSGMIAVFLLPILSTGADDNYSSVIIIDPKNAELSQCSNVLSPTYDGNVRHILTAIEQFNESRIKRQKILNELSKESGMPVSWRDAGMHPSILCIDEFVSLDGLFPKKPSKDDPDYCIDKYKALIRAIATQGASAGCFLILSTAEASVGAGGLESIVNNACGIKILFKPSKTEASFLWNAVKLEDMPDYDFHVGDAWISVDDGIHNDIEIVKFPRLELGEYKLLDEYLKSYYS